MVARILRISRQAIYRVPARRPQAARRRSDPAADQLEQAIVAVALANQTDGRTVAQQKIGGFNGDVLGATEQLAEIGILLLVASASAGIPWWRG